MTGRPTRRIGNEIYLVRLLDAGVAPVVPAWREPCQSAPLCGREIERETRGYTIPYGGWKDVLDAGGWVGPTARPEPIEAALSALASCINVGISMNALAADTDIEELEPRVQTEFDPAVLFSLAGLDDADTVFNDAEAEIEVEGEHIDTVQVEEWAQRAPVYTLVSLAQDIDISIDATTEVATDDYGGATTPTSYPYRSVVVSRSATSVDTGRAVTGTDVTFYSNRHKPRARLGV